MAVGKNTKERHRKEGKSSEWTLKRIREACEKVAKIGRLDIVQEILRKSTEFLRRGHCASRWNGRSHCVVRLPASQQFSIGGLSFGGYRRDTETATTERRSTAVGGVRCVEANTNGERPTGYWLVHQCQ